MYEEEMLACPYCGSYDYTEMCAQTVSYSYKALAAEGCRMTYSVSKQDSAYSIIAK